MTQATSTGESITTTRSKDHFYRVATFFSCADLARKGYRP